MSSVTTTKIDTKDGATNLTLTTGNTIGPKVVVSSVDGIWIGNSSANVFISNNQNTSINTPLTVSGGVTSNGTLLTTSGTVTTNGSLIVNGSITGVSTFAANTINGANANISSNTLNLGTSSIAGSGYTRLPNGLLYQWGSASVNNTTPSITYPTSFSTVYSIVATSSVTTATYQAAVTSVATTWATIRTANTNSITVYWMAIGV